MAEEKQVEAVAEVHHQASGAQKTAIPVVSERPVGPSGEERKKRWRRSIHEMLQLAQGNIDSCADAQERERRMQAVRHLRRQEEKLDEQDDDAWAAAHPPKRMPEARVAYFRAVLEGQEGFKPPFLPETVAPYFPGGLDAVREFNDGLRDDYEADKQLAAEVVDEYEANGYVEHLDAESFELTPELKSVIFR